MGRAGGKRNRQVNGGPIAPERQRRDLPVARGKADGSAGLNPSEVARTTRLNAARVPTDLPNWSAGRRRERKGAPASLRTPRETDLRAWERSVYLMDGG